MLEEEEIREAFKILNLLDEGERQKMLSYGIVQSTFERETIQKTTLDNATVSKIKEKSGDA